jgi:GPI transamidase subunit PIG-U
MPYPTLSDPWLACVIGASQVHIVKLLPTVSWFWLTLAAVSATFMPVMRSLWLGPGSGNANFYFNMVSGGYFSCIVVDVIWGICQGMLHTLAWSLLLGNYVSTAVKSCSAKNVKAE